MIESNVHAHAPHPFRTSSFGFWPRHDLGDERGALTVPYVGQTRMQLTISSGLAEAHVRVEPDAADLIAIDCCETFAPRLRASASELRLSWPATFGAWLRAALAGECRDIELVLHPAVEWTVHVRSGLSRFEADLAAGKLAGLHISGGVSDAFLDLPAPAAVVPVRIAGGVSQLTLRRPAAAGVELAISGGVSRLCLDDQSFGAIGGPARLASGAIRGDVPGYAVAISGGASGLEIVGRSS